MPKQDLPVWPVPSDITEHPVFGYPVAQLQLQHSSGSKRVLCPRSLAACKKLRQQGWTYKAIAELFEVHRNTVRDSISGAQIIPQ